MFYVLQWNVCSLVANEQEFKRFVDAFKERHGACTMIVDEKIQSYVISFELTKLNHSNLALLVPWSWSSIFSVNSGLTLS